MSEAASDHLEMRGQRQGALPDLSASAHLSARAGRLAAYVADRLADCLAGQAASGAGVAESLGAASRDRWHKH